MGVFDDLGALELRGELQRQGFDDVVQIVEDLHEFDPSKLRLLAEQVYGTSHGGSLGVSTVVPDRVAHLVEASEEQRRTTVEERWGGPAYENFAAYMREVEADLAKEEDRLRLLGDALLQAADIFEQADDEITGAIAGASTAYGVVTMLLSAGAAALSVQSVAGTVFGVAALAYEANRSVTEQCSAISAAVVALKELGASGGSEFVGASSLLSGIANAFEETDNVEEWRATSTDPHS